MKVLMIGSDRNLFVKNSSVALRLKEYGKLADEIHIIVFSLKSLDLRETKIASNVWVYPTNSMSKWLYVHDSAKLGKKLVNERKFVRGDSLITAQDPFESGLVGLKIKKKWRLPLEVQLHTDPFSSYFKGLLNGLRKGIAPRVIREADSLRVVTESLKNKISEKFDIDRKDISVLPIFVDRQKFESGQPAFDLHTKYGRRFLMLCVSRLAEEKNIELALKVLKLVNQKFPEAGLVIVGSGPEESKLRAAARRLGVEEFVAFEGWQEDLLSYYRTADVFLQTSKYEGYGLSLMEAGLSGMPILTTPVGVAVEFEHGQDLYICPPGNPEYWAEVILSLVENNQKRIFMGMNMRRAVEEKLLSKKDYLSKLKNNWLSIAKNMESK